MNQLKKTILSLTLLALSLQFGYATNVVSVKGQDTLNPEVAKIKAHFEATYGENPFPYYPNLEPGGKKIEMVLKFLWDKYTIHEQDSLKVYEFRVIEAASYGFSTLIEAITFTLIAIDNGKEITYYLMKFMHMRGSDQNATFRDRQNFTGTAKAYNTNNELACFMFLQTGEIQMKIAGAAFVQKQVGNNECIDFKSTENLNENIYDFVTPTCNMGG